MWECAFPVITDIFASPQQASLLQATGITGTRIYFYMIWEYAFPVITDIIVPLHQYPPTLIATGITGRHL
jgi:hypothetical protein